MIGVSLSPECAYRDQQRSFVAEPAKLIYRRVRCDCRTNTKLPLWRGALSVIRLKHISDFCRPFRDAASLVMWDPYGRLQIRKLMSTGGASCPLAPCCAEYRLPIWLTNIPPGHMQPRSSVLWKPIAVWTRLGRVGALLHHERHRTVKSARRFTLSIWMDHQVTGGSIHSVEPAP